MSNKFDFKKQLSTGKKGENAFMHKFSDKIVHICEDENICGADFRIKKTGELIELKTDSYDMTKTPNFFIERWSDHNSSKPGGPWQARDKGATYFIYYFIKNNKYFIYEVNSLIEALEPIIENMGHIFIQNKGWTTSGYKVKRELLKHLELKVKDVL